LRVANHPYFENNTERAGETESETKSLLQGIRSANLLFSSSSIWFEAEPPSTADEVAIVDYPVHTMQLRS
jgi:hypothetical protein